jgi:hypothetical protein
MNNQFEPDELNRDFELASGDRKQRLMEKLLLRNPDKVLADHFGIAQLKDNAKSLGLVAIDIMNDKPIRFVLSELTPAWILKAVVDEMKMLPKPDSYTARELPCNGQSKDISNEIWVS